MEQNLHGKVALVTGGNSGMGKATALLLARSGAKVAIAARRVAELESVVKEIASFGGLAVAFPTDISKADEVNSLITEVVSHFGQLDLAFNNAGVMGKWASIDDQNLDDFEQTIGTNLRGTWLCCQAEIAQMAKQTTGGAIVNTSSWLAQGAIAGSTLYSMSKAGIDGMTRALALETAPLSIRINNISPGIIDTEMLRQNSDDVSRAPYIAHTPMGRVGTAEEVAELVLWLCSEASRFITGQSILVDGGYTISGHRG